MKGCVLKKQKTAQRSETTRVRGSKDDERLLGRLQKQEMS